MNMKVLFMVFLCLFSVSVICSVAMTVMNTASEYSQTEPALTSDLALDGDGIDPIVDDKGGGGWP